MSQTREFLTRPRRAPSWIRPGLKWIGVGLGVLVVLMLVAAKIMQALAVREAHKLTWLDGYTPPARAVVCEDQLTADCAQAAANRMQVPVAWLQPPPGYQFRWLLALSPTTVPSSKRVAEETLTSTTVELDLVTQPAGPWQPGNERLLGTYVENGTRVQVYRDILGDPRDQGLPLSLSLRWQHERRQYELSVIPHYMLGRVALDPADGAAFVAGVRYAVPQN